MTEDFEVEVLDYVVITLWLRPRFLPYSYKQTVDCSYLCEWPPTLYSQQSLSGTETAQRIVSDRIRPGSRCELKFKAVYNTASRDDGIIKTVLTQIDVHCITS